MSEQRNRVKVQHIRSNVSEKVDYEGARIKFPKLPEPEVLNDGEIAVNFGEGVETLSIKNSSNDVVRFVNEKELDDIAEVSAGAFAQLNDKIDEGLVMDDEPVEGSEKAVKSGGIYNALEEKQDSDFVVYLIGTGAAVGPDKTYAEIREAINDGKHDVYLWSKNLSGGSRYELAGYDRDKVIFSRVVDNVMYVYEINSDGSFGMHTYDAKNVIEGVRTLEGFTVGEWVDGDYVYDDRETIETPSEEVLYIDILNNEIYRWMANEDGEGYRYVKLCDISGKQDVLTFDSAPTSHSTNPVTSGGVYTAVNAKADKALRVHFTRVGEYDGTQLAGELSSDTTVADIYQAYTEGRLITGELDNIDCQIIFAVSGGCGFEGMFAGRVCMIGGNGNGNTDEWGYTITEASITMDSEPTEGSTNAVTSGGVYRRLAEDDLVVAAAMNDLNDRINTLSSDVNGIDESLALKADKDTTYTKDDVDHLLSEKQDTLTFDPSPTDHSTNPVISGGVYSALAGKQDTLVDSGNDQNIKTVNGTSLLGSGNIDADDVVHGALNGSGTGLDPYEFRVGTWMGNNYMININDTPVTPDENKIYVDVKKNKIYRYRNGFVELCVPSSDSVPTEDSTNLITSGGVYDKFAEYSLAISSAINGLNDRIDALEQENLLLKGEIEMLKTQV